MGLPILWRNKYKGSEVMPKYNVKFNFDVDFECEEDDLNDAVADWWSECTDIPYYDTYESEEE